MPETAIKEETVCFHCGAPTTGSPVDFDGKHFCCAGCKAVYEILARNQLCQYYNFETSPGRTPSIRPARKFEFLDDAQLKGRLVDYSDGAVSLVHFIIPQIHCSSCIWLLENLRRLDPGVLFSRVDFLKKQVLIRYSETDTSLRKVVELLSSVGYEPELNLGTAETRARRTPDRSLYVKLGVAAFCFGNIMLFSLPEYFAASRGEGDSRTLFGYINLLLALPVVLYSSSLFYISALQGLRKRIVNIDLPIALGIAIVFLRSVVDVLGGYGPGYFDSLAGLVFLLLIGRLFQNKTYEALNFERTYHSYFPLAVSVRRKERDTTVPLRNLRPGDRILIRNNEIVPADSVLMRGMGNIDYSFVTGESSPVAKIVGETVYAGGRHAGAVIELEIIKEVAESELVQLWNDHGSAEHSKSRLLTLSATAGKYFTAAILLIAAATTVGWWYLDPARILDAATATLIVACPCALALAAPFAFGTTMRILGRKGLFLRSASVVESLGKIDTIVLDKTGTITETRTGTVHFVGKLLESERVAVASLARNSTHPLSRAIADHLAIRQETSVSRFAEREGAGIEGWVNETFVQMGSAEFVGAHAVDDDPEKRRTRVYVAIDDCARGWFEFSSVYRAGLETVLTELGSRYSIAVLSGDGSSERSRLTKLYPAFMDLCFQQQPSDKLDYIRSLQTGRRRVLMIGDGLNDSGALWQSDVGIAVTDDTSAFSPACDAILHSRSFRLLDRFVRLARTSMSVVYWSFGISLIYNLVGLSFAIRGELSPLLAAILMPLSSISVVLFATLTTQLIAKRQGLS